MNNRRMTLGPMSASSANVRGNMIGAITANSQTIVAKRLSLATGAAPPAIISTGATVVPAASRRMSMGAVLPPPIRQPGQDVAGTARCVQ
jgi:hypothetical protein